MQIPSYFKMKLKKQDIPDNLKRKIAAEMNLSETAFVTIGDNENGETFQKSSKFDLRWFTPTHEVDLCGHVQYNSLIHFYLGSINL